MPAKASSKSKRLLSHPRIMWNSWKKPSTKIACNMAKNRLKKKNESSLKKEKSEIGRASCREREKNWGGGVLLKKKEREENTRPKIKRTNGSQQPTADQPRTKRVCHERLANP